MKWVVIVLAAGWASAGFVATTCLGQGTGANRAFKIVTFGASTTAKREGIEVYTTQLENRLRSTYPSAVWVNKGVPGSTTETARQRFGTDVIREKPDLVIIQFGINDSAIDVWRKPPSQVGRVSLTAYKDNLRFFVREIRKQGGEAILMTPNQVRWTPRLRELYGKAPYDPTDEKGFAVPVREYSAAVREVADELRVDLVDVFKLYDEWEVANAKSCSMLMTDGMHPNTLGHTLVADALVPIVRRLLEK